MRSKSLSSIFISRTICSLFSFILNLFFIFFYISFIYIKKGGKLKRKGRGNNFPFSLPMWAHLILLSTSALRVDKPVAYYWPKQKGVVVVERFYFGKALACIEQKVFNAKVPVHSNLPLSLPTLAFNSKQETSGCCAYIPIA